MATPLARARIAGILTFLDEARTGRLWDRGTNTVQIPRSIVTDATVAIRQLQRDAHDATVALRAAVAIADQFWPPAATDYKTLRNDLGSLINCIHDCAKDAQRPRTG